MWRWKKYSIVYEATVRARDEHEAEAKAESLVLYKTRDRAHTFLRSADVKVNPVVKGVAEEIAPTARRELDVAWLREKKKDSRTWKWYRLTRPAARPSEKKVRELRRLAKEAGKHRRK